jgi:hypothetical protein
MRCSRIFFSGAADRSKRRAFNALDMPFWRNSADGGLAVFSVQSYCIYLIDFEKWSA